MEFIESFMKFSFADDDVFRIEVDELVRGHSGRKACECVVLISPQIAFIEAKPSTPNPNSRKRFDEFIDDIKQKFTDSLNLFEGIKKGQLGEDALMRLPVNLRNAEVPTKDYLIYLIVHGHRLDWLPGLQDALREALRDVVKEWNLRDSNVKALNEEIAKELHLITAYVSRDNVDSLRQDNGNADELAVSRWFTENGI